jgi:hypothetical protein
MGAVYPGTTRASFELERLEFDGGRLLVGGWWFGVRGMRFVRPALLVDGRKVLATLEHKPWAPTSDGAWTAAFPWQEGASLDVSGVTLVVAPSVEVPLDRESSPPELEAALDTLPAAVVVEQPPAPAPAAEAARPPSGEQQTLRDELEALERRLDEMRSELHETRAVAAEREARCRELERAASRERRAAEQAGVGSDELVRAQAMAVLDRDRVRQQLDEAVTDREAAIRTRARMQVQHDEALAQCEAAQAQRDEVLAERDEARRQRDEVLLAHATLQEQLKGEWAASARAQPAAQAPAEPPTAVLRAPTERTRAAAEQPSGVRVIPATRTVGAHLHRAARERDRGVTSFDLWAIRIFGSVAAVAFISLLVMILKAFFVF